MRKSFKDKVVLVARWGASILAAFLSLTLLIVENGLAFVSLFLFAVSICPLMDRPYARVGIKRWQKRALRVGLFVLAFIFIVSHDYSASESHETTSSISIEDNIYESNQEPSVSGSAIENVASEVSSASYSSSEDVEEFQEDASEDNSADEGIQDEVEESSSLKVTFLDVGQGDCTIVECDDHCMLIDCGPEDSGTKIQLYLTKNNIDNIDYLILTHPDADHIGGADVIITKYNIDNIFMLDFYKDTRTYENLLDAIDYRGYKWEQPFIDTTYELGAASFMILGPSKSFDDVNDSSIVVKVKFGNNSFLFTGDCESEGEYDLVSRNVDLKSDIYHVGHHGSHSSSHDWFMKKVQPACAIISCGKDNSYGHPHTETIDYFANNGIPILRTDELGNITAVSDGNKVEIMY